MVKAELTDVLVTVSVLVDVVNTVKPRRESRSLLSACAAPSDMEPRSSAAWSSRVLAATHTHTHTCIQAGRVGVVLYM